MKSIEWNANIIGATLSGNYPEILLCLSVTLSIISVVACFLLSKRAKEIEADCIRQSRLVGNVVAELIIIQQNIREIFRTIEPNADNIAMLQVQMDKVNELLGTVMGASDLVGFNSPEERVEEMRNRLKWERERRKFNQLNQSDYYQG